MAQDEGREGSVLDFTGQGVRRIELVPNAWPTTLIYDKNNLTRIENLDAYTDLQQLSVAENQLTRMVGVSQLTNLTVLSLPSNSILAIEGLKNLTKLTWLSLSGNNIKVIEGLQSLTSLQHLDLSDNSISHVSDISNLSSLRSLLLHGNIISSLRTASTLLPLSLSILSLAENEISDLNEVCQLANLQNLEQLSVMNNPGVVMTGATPGFDYRPFVINWCLNLHILDGYVVSEKESLKAEWLYSQGKGRHFRPGQHFLLAQYLASVCPLTSAQDLESLEEQRLARILQHQRRLQQELDDGNRRPELAVAGDSTASQEFIRAHQPAANISSSSREDSGITHGNKMEVAHNIPKVGSPMKAWMQDPSVSVDSSRPFTAPGHRKEGQEARHAHDVELVDMTSEDESRSSASQLSCETRYLPLHSDSNSPSPAHSFQNLVNNPGNARPVTAPPGGKPQGTVTSFAEIFANAEREQRPASALEGGRSHIGARSRMAANFGQASRAQSYLPTPSEAQPLAHHHKGPASPLSKGKDFLEDTDTDSISTDASSASLELKVLKALLNNHKAQKQKFKKGHSPASQYKAESRSNKYSVEEKLQQPEILRDISNIQLEPSDKMFVPEDLERSLAATKLQALWRGFKARHKDPEVVKIRTEIRAKRAEEHIRHLMGEVSRQRDLYEQEKQMRLLQLEAVKHLWKEVQSLQQWKQEVLASHDYSMLSHDGKTTPQSQQHSTQELIDNLNAASATTFNPNAAVGASVAIRKGPHLSIPSPAPSKSLDIASAKSHSGAPNRQIEHLQQQVSHLQEVVQSVYQGNVIGTTKDPYAVAASMVSESIRVSTDFEDNQEKETACQLNLEGDNKTRPAPGIPTAPGQVQYQIHEKNCVVLRWSPSVIYDSQGQLSSQPLIGYRLYINEKAKALVGGSKSCALIEGLHEHVMYRVYVRAVSALGESENSNTVKVCLSKNGWEFQEKSSHTDDPDDSNEPGGSHKNCPKGQGKNQNEKRESQNDKQDSNTIDQSQGSAGHQRLTVPSKSVSEGSSLITGDSGYLSSPCNTANTSGKHGESPSKDLVKSHAAFMPPHDTKTRKATVGEMLEKRLHSSRASPENSSKLNFEEVQAWSEKVHSSPRMKEGLIKKLDQQPVKKGVMREELMAAKVKKRSLESPMKAIAVEESAGDTQDDISDAKLKSVLVRQRRRTSSGSDKDEVKQESTFSRERPGYQSMSRRYGSPSSIPKPVSKTPSNELLVYNPDSDDADSGATNTAEITKDISCILEMHKSKSRESSRPGSREASRSGSVETLATNSKDLNEQKTAKDEGKLAGADNKKVGILHERLSVHKSETEENGMERYIRGRASARETRNAKVHIDEKRSSSVGAPTKKVHEKPPLAKPTPGKDRRSSSREEIKAARKRTSSGQSQPSSEDEESRIGRDVRLNSGNGGTPSSGSDKEVGDERHKPVTTNSPDAKEMSPKGMVLSHKRSSSDVVFKPLPNRPISPASKPGTPSMPNTPQQALNSPRFRRSSSFSKSVTGEGKDAESILRQCISLELLKAAKQQDVRAAAERAIAAAESSTDAGSPSQPEFNLARSRINASVIVRQSIERLNRKDPKYKSEGPIRGRSHSLSNSAKKTKSKSPKPDTSSKHTSRTAPAALSSPPAEHKNNIQLSDVVSETMSKPSTSENNPVIDPIPSDSTPKVSSKSSDSSTSSSPESSVEKSSKRHKFGNKAHDLFQKLHMKLSTNKP